MYNSTLSRKTPLKARNGLKSHTSLKVKKDLRTSYAEKVKSGQKKVKKTYQKAYKPGKIYESIFTKELSRCYITNTLKCGANVHIHHVFGGARKALSEKYGFIIPLRADWHDMADYGVHFNKELDRRLKSDCEDYYLAHIGTREDFISEFGMWWPQEDVRELSDIINEVVSLHSEAA